MKTNEIKEIARRHNIKVCHSKKADLVRSIQLAEGNQTCFDTGISGQCEQLTCTWREDCK